MRIRLAKRALVAAPLAAVLVMASTPLDPAQAATATSGSWHGVSYDIDSAGVVTFHSGTFTGNFTDDPFSAHEALASATEIGADGTVKLPADSYCMFQDCSNLVAVDLSNFDSSEVTDIDSMFDGCSSLTSVYFGGFDTAEAESMENMFSDCVSLVSLDASGFDTTSATTFDGMFSGCTALSTLDISSFSTIGADSMSDMFSDCDSLKYVALGDGFSFSGSGSKRLCSFPKGTWAPDTSGRSYDGDEIPNQREATYTRLSRMTPDTEVKQLVEKRAEVSITVAADDGKTMVMAVKARKVNKKKKTAYISLQKASVAGTMIGAKAVRRAPLKKVKKKLPAKYVIHDLFRGKWHYVFTEIGRRAFKGASGVKNIIVPSRVSKIGAQAFIKCSATKLTLRTMQLTKKSRVRNCLQRSNVKLVTVRFNAKRNNDLKKAYRKVFKKSIVGKKAKVK